MARTERTRCWRVPIRPVTPFITMPTLRTMTSRLLPRMSLYSFNVILYPPPRPRAVADYDPVVQGKLLSGLQRVLVVEHERATHAGVGIVAHEPLAREPHVRRGIHKQDCGAMSGPVVQPDVRQPRGRLAHHFRSLQPVRG